MKLARICGRFRRGPLDCPAGGVDKAVPAEVITRALMRRFRSRKTDPFSERMLAALRREFDGHAVKKIDE